MSQRYVKMEVAKGQWVEWSIDPWDDPPDGHVSVIEDGKEYWEIVRSKKPSTSAMAGTKGEALRAPREGAG